jgi:hypothetical protein
MGVNTYILDRRRQRLSIGNAVFEVGSLRQFWKITELDADRGGELMAASRHALPSPKAAIVIQVLEMTVAASGSAVRAHPVIGWDEGRSAVTDSGWDYLPTLGYAVRSADGEFVLHEETNEGLRPMNNERALQLGLLSSEGELVRHGQPEVVSCREVRGFIPGYLQADCTLADGTRHWLLVHTTAEEFPAPSWFVGKQPRAISEYVSH